MNPALIFWAAMRAIFNVSVGVEGQSHKTAGMETQISAAVKLIPRKREKKKRKKKCPQGKETVGTKKIFLKEAPVFSSAREIYGARAHAAVARLNRLIMNTVAAVTLAGRR